MTPLTQTSIEEAITSDEAINKASLQIAQDIARDGKYDISQFVEQLGFLLTAPKSEARVSGTKLLTAVLAQLPKDFLNATQLEFLSTFYADRLKDHHNVIPVVIDGIQILIAMKQLPMQSIPKLLNSFFQHTTCQSQQRNDRAKLFQIFKYLTENYAEVLKSMAGDFIYGLINSIDGERDPRNLDYIFSFMPSVISDFPLLHLSEEMFEIFACYFPIDFTPSSNDPDTITRDNLAEKLARCLVASTEFTEGTVSMALEKLDSDLVEAKLDSLELLHQSALKYPAKLMEPHFDPIWTALKAEIFPGPDNSDIIAAGLKVLRTILEQAGAIEELSHNYQTTILGTILPHLSDVSQKLFHPSAAIALVCISGDAKFTAEKILNTFLIKLTANDEHPLNDEERIKVYMIIAQIFKIISLRDCLDQINGKVCEDLHTNIIAALRCNSDADDGGDVKMANVDLVRAALSALNECVPIISESNRALIYKALVQLMTHEAIDVDLSHLIERLGALHPIELQSNCIDVFMRNFVIYPNVVKRKVFDNLLPLQKQIAFTQRVLDLVLTNVFKDETSNDVRLLALEALNSMLRHEDDRFIQDLQTNNCLIDKLIHLAQSISTNTMDILEQIASSLSLIIQQLSVSEQYIIATEYLPKLNLQLEADLFIAKGLLGFLHKDISLDEHFERLLNDLTSLSLKSDNELLRQVAHHLLCSLVNKIDYNDQNRGTLAKTIEKLKAEMKKENAKAVEALSWLAKGLMVRGADDLGDIIEALAELLDHPSLSNIATLGFEIISTAYPQLHLPIVKLLYKQKFFHMILSKMDHKLQTYCEHHLNAFIYVIKATPHPILKMNIEKVGPVLFKCLESTQVHTLCIALEVCENFIRQQDEYFRSHINHIIPSCLQLSTYNKSMQVRIVALNVLHDITHCPTFLLLPYKTDVQLELAAALDDPKRLVRNAAVRTRNAWFLVGSPIDEEQ